MLILQGKTTRWILKTAVAVFMTLTDVIPPNVSASKVTLDAFQRVAWLRLEISGSKLTPGSLTRVKKGGRKRTYTFFFGRGRISEAMAFSRTFPESMRKTGFCVHCSYVDSLESSRLTMKC